MLTDALAIPDLRRRPLVLKASTLAAVAVAVAVALSSIVFSEPAIADALMAVVIVLVPVLGQAKFGRAALVNFALWLVVVGLGLAVAGLSPTADSAVKHQLVTLFLAAGAIVLAGYISKDPEPRVNLVLWAYSLACLIATLAAFAGYFRLLPGAFDLFTNYGRARGTFKDPNVYGAALVLALAHATVIMLREPAKRAAVGALVALPLMIGLLISFSRGAWIAAVLALGMAAFLLAAHSRRHTDIKRFGWASGLGIVLVMLALGAATQVEQVRTLLEQRASLDQSYDVGPDGRFGGQQKARQLMLDNPFGIGTHTFREVYHHEEVHNVYLTTFLNAGWLGGFVYIATVVATLVLGLRVSMTYSAIQVPAIAATSAFAAIAFEGYVIDSDHWRHFFILMAIIWGLADATPPARSPDHRIDDPVS